MRFNQRMICFSAGLMMAVHSVSAGSAPLHEQFQVPQCLAEKMAVQQVVLAENKQFKIIELASNKVETLARLADQVQCGRFINVSHRFITARGVEKKHLALSLLKKATRKIEKTPSSKEPLYEIKHQEQVNSAIKGIVSDNIWQTLNQLTAFHDRSATKDTGVQAANWLKSRFEEMALASGRRDTTTFFVKTGWYKQPSLVTVIGKDIQAPAVVIGAHMDTLDGLMPGAGDDGSGSATIMEMARVLLASKTAFKRPIYIIWYAAEERGLVGSQHVVQYFQEKNRPVKAAIQFDMTGYRVNKEDPTMWVFTDYTDDHLSHYVARLIDAYVHVPVDYSRCGYGCSDHASWDAEGVPAAFPCESNFEDHNPYIHSSSDTMDLLNLDHMTNFTKLALAFAIELASD